MTRIGLGVRLLAFFVVLGVVSPDCAFAASCYGVYYDFWTEVCWELVRRDERYFEYYDGPVQETPIKAGCHAIDTGVAQSVSASYQEGVGGSVDVADNLNITYEVIQTRSESKSVRLGTRISPGHELKIRVYPRYKKSFHRNTVKLRIAFTWVIYEKSGFCFELDRQSYRYDFSSVTKWDTSSPQLSVSGPNSGAVSGAVSLTATANDGSGSCVHSLTLDGVAGPDAPTVSKQTVATPTLVCGSNSFVAIAYDGAANSANTRHSVDGTCAMNEPCCGSECCADDEVCCGGVCCPEECCDNGNCVLTPVSP